MKKMLLPLMLLAGSSLFAAPRFSVGVRFGNPGYYAPPAAVALQPPCPGPGYTWVDGYYGPSGVWIAGYWAPPVGAYVAPDAPFYGRGGDRDDHRFVDRDGFRGHDGHDGGRAVAEGRRR